MTHRLENQPQAAYHPEISWYIPSLAVDDLHFASAVTSVSPTEPLHISLEKRPQLKAIFELADELLERDSHTPDTGIIAVLPDYEARAHTQLAVEAACSLLIADQDAVCVPLLYGTATMTADIVRYFGSDESVLRRIIPFVVSRSEGVSLTKSHIWAPPDAPKRIRAASKVFILDDLIDKGGAAVHTALTVASIRGVPVWQTDISLTNQLNGEGVFNTQAHKRLDELLIQAKTLCITPFTKNPQLTETLSHAARKIHPNHPQLLHQLHHVKEIHPQAWVMGAYGIDTGARWNDIYQGLLGKNRAFFHQPEVAAALDPLTGALIRAGQSVGSLFALHPQTNGPGQFEFFLNRYTTYVWQACEILLD